MVVVGIDLDYDSLFDNIKNMSDLTSTIDKMGLNDEEKNKVMLEFEDYIYKDTEEIVKDDWKCGRCKAQFKLKRNKKPLECPSCGKEKRKTSFEALSGPYQYFTFNPHTIFRPKLLGEDILEENHYMTLKDSGDVYVWDDGYYKREGVTHIKKTAQMKLSIESETKRKNKTVDYIESATYVDRDELNKSKLIAVENGVLDVVEKKLMEPDPDKHYMTMKLPVRYDPDADCPRIKEFLKDIVREQDIVTIQEMCGYILYKEYIIAKAFMLHGAGANGKSTLINLIESFIGKENVANPSLQKIMKDKYAAAELYGKLACLHADLSSTKLEDTGKFKMLTGGDMIRGERKYQNPFKFKNFAKLIFSANELPYTKDTTDAFFRRWVIIDFPNQFDEDDEDTDPNILDKLTTEEELSGFLNFVLDGLERILEQEHFTHSSSMDSIKEKWILKTDPFLAFFEKHIEESSTGQIPKEELPGIEDKPNTFYKAYKDFCNKNDKTAKKKGTITKRLKTKIPLIDEPRPEIHGKRVRLFAGLKFKDASEYSYLNITDDMKKPIKNQKQLFENSNEEKRSESIVEKNGLGTTVPMNKEIRDFLDDNKKTMNEIVEHFQDCDEDLLIDKVLELLDQGRIMRNGEKYELV